MVITMSARRARSRRLIAASWLVLGVVILTPEVTLPHGLHAAALLDAVGLGHIYNG